MSKALKCNRCGCCFDPESNPDAEIVNFWNPTYTKGNDYFDNIEFIESVMFKSGSRRIDLCPACARDFSAFMKCETKPVIDVSRENEIKKYLEEIELLKNEIDRLTDELFSEQNARADCEATIDLQDDELSRTLKARTDAEETVRRLELELKNSEAVKKTLAEELNEAKTVRDNLKEAIDFLIDTLDSDRKYKIMCEELGEDTDGDKDKNYNDALEIIKNYIKKASEMPERKVVCWEPERYKYAIKAIKDYFANAISKEGDKK